MIDFFDFHFSDNGILKYVEHRGRKFFCDSPLWNVVCKNSEYNIYSMTDFSFIIEGEYIELIWKNDILKVSVTIIHNDRYEFNISVFSTCLKIDNIKFPILNDVNSIANSNENLYMLLPYQNGWLIKDPISTILNYKGETPFWLGRGKGYYENEYPAAYSFQCFSFYDNETFGCYFATEDYEAYIKTFGIYGDDSDGMRFVLTNYPENMGEVQEYCQPYDFVICFFDGDWQDSVEIYREWAVKQKWIRGKLKDIGINKKILDTDLWRINHTNYELGTRTQEYLDTAIKIKEKTNANISLHWYGWNMGEHDVNYPEYISRKRVKERWNKELVNWIDKLKCSGFNVIPYVNARLWDSGNELWKETNAKKSAIKDRDGDLLYEPWKGDRLKPMCPATYLWNETVSDFSKYINESKFDGLYVDQVGSYNATLCFDKNHPHPIGGGTWWKNNYNHMINMLRKKSLTNSFFTTESCCEAYIDTFDLFLVLDTTVAANRMFKSMDNFNAEPVPMFNMIYGDYAQLYGSNARFSDKIEVFEFNFIRNILWGIMPTVEGLDAEEINRNNAQDYFDVINRGVKFYKENKDVLLYGRIKRIEDANSEKLILNFEETKIAYDSVILVDWEYEDEIFKFAYNFSSNEQIFYDDQTIDGHSFKIMKQ